ncbi:hypothetical protein RB594_003927 [Gaeumannomyces avenae]
MAGYAGRRGAPNVSQYLRELTNIQPVTPAATTGPEEGFGIDDDLVMFTNTQFFDFETGQNTDYQSHPAKPESEPTQSEPPSNSASVSTTTVDDFSTLDFMSGDFNFPDFGAAYTSPTLQTYSDNINGLQPLQTGAQSIYPVPPTHRSQQQNGYTPAPRQRPTPAKASSPESSVSPHHPASFEDASRLAAEEDKRKRNTAASARFRIKKKQREQALEKSAKEMNDKVATLESRISQLETENKWLKNLIMEKNDGNEDIAKLWKDFSAKHKAGLKGDGGKAATKKPVPASPEEHEGGEMTG